MKSGKQRKREIKEHRQKKAERLAAEFGVRTPQKVMPKGAINADPAELMHNNTWDTLPTFYVDKVFFCQDCGSEEIWTAEQQKWWYETAKGDIHSKAIRCRVCRDVIKNEKAEQRKHMDEMENKPPHPHKTFFKKRFFAI